MLWHLNKHLWIELPGFGHIKADKISAYIDANNSTIHPSKLKLQFTHLALQRTEEMVRNIHLHTGYSVESIEQSLANLLYHLSQELRVRNEVELQPFGKLFYTKTSNILQFKSTDKNIHQNFFGLGEYKLVSITTLPIPKTIITNTISPTSKSEEKFNKNLLWLIAFLWLLFLGLMLCPAKKSSDSKIIPLTKDTATKISQTPVESKNDSILLAKIETTITDSAKNNPQYKNEEEIKETNITKLTEEVKNKKCVIIVGSFTKKFNANRMIRRVKKNRFKSYTEMYGEYQRVGVEFDCMKKDLQTVLNELKTKFDQKAWVLKW